MLSLALLLALPTHAHALTVSVSCAQQADNTLRFDCVVETDHPEQPTDVYVRFGRDTTEGCDLERTTAVSSGTGTRTFVLYGMKPSTDYDFRAFATLPGALESPSFRSGCGTAATGALPTGSGTSRIDQLRMETAVGVGARRVRNFLTHGGCEKDGVDDQHLDALVVLDQDGDIVWYQEPAVDLGATDVADPQPVTLEGMSYSASTNTILAILNRQIIVEYSLDGQLQHLFCRGDGSQPCEGTTTYADLYFDHYVHHDVQRYGDRIFALAANAHSVPDTQDCDRDGDVTEGTSIVLDGVYAFDLSTETPTLAVDWDWTRVPETPIDYEEGNADPGVSECTSGFWGEDIPGFDYLHTNSFSIDDEGRWLFSVHRSSEVWWVDRNRRSGNPDFNHRVLSLAADNSGDVELAPISAYSSVFDGQHAVRPVRGSSSQLVMFDNRFAMHSDSRAVIFDVTGDEKSGYVATPTHQYAMLDVSGNPLYCETGGSAVPLTGGNLFATCASAGDPPKATFIDFSGDDQPAWTLSLGCEYGFTATATAYAGLPNLW